MLLVEVSGMLLAGMVEVPTLIMILKEFQVVSWVYSFVEITNNLDK